MVVVIEEEKEERKDSSAEVKAIKDIKFENASKSEPIEKSEKKMDN